MLKALPKEGFAPRRGPRAVRGHRRPARPHPRRNHRAGRGYLRHPHGRHLPHLRRCHPLFLARVGPGPSPSPAPQNALRDLHPRRRRLFEITDARYHKDYRPDGIMISGRAFRFYAGVPSPPPPASPSAVLFVQDSVPHTLTEMQKRALETLSRQVINRFELMSRMRYMSRDSRMRLRVESELTIERNFVSTVLDTVGALVAVFDTAGRIVRFQPRLRAGLRLRLRLARRRLRLGETHPALRDPRSHRNLRAPPRRQVPRLLRKLLAQQKRHPPPHRLVRHRPRRRTGPGQLHHRHRHRRHRPARGRSHPHRKRSPLPPARRRFARHGLHPRPQGHLLSVNTHGAESLGRTVDEMAGQSLTALMPAEHRGSMPPTCARSPRPAKPRAASTSATKTATSASSPSATSSSSSPIPSPARSPTSSASASTSPTRSAPKKSSAPSSTSPTPSSSP